MRPAVLGMLFSCVLLSVVCGVRAVKAVHFNQDVGGHLERAASANQVPLAISEIETALTGLDDRNMTLEKLKGRCYTSIMYQTPDEDVCFWRTNLEQTLGDLKSLPEDAEHLTVSNTLLKVRETLTTSSQSGESVTVPPGISVYGQNTFYAVLMFLGLLLGILFGWKFLVRF